MYNVFEVKEYAFKKLITARDVLEFFWLLKGVELSHQFTEGPFIEYLSS